MPSLIGMRPTRVKVGRGADALASATARTLSPTPAAHFEGLRGSSPESYERRVRLRVAAAFFAVVVRFAVPRLRVAAAFFAAALRLAAFFLRVAAAFFAAALR
jgi:hypothetical protein